MSASAGQPSEATAVDACAIVIHSQTARLCKLTLLSVPASHAQAQVSSGVPLTCPAFSGPAPGSFVPLFA